MGNQPLKPLPRSASEESPVTRHNRKLLEDAGVTLDANGRAVFVDGRDGNGGGDPEGEDLSGASPYGTLHEGEDDGLSEGGETVTQHQDGEVPPAEPQDKPVSGLEKRELDARNAQVSMERARGALRQVLEEANAAINRLTELRNGVELKIPDMNPAQPEEIEEFRRVYPTEYGVMESLVKPVYEMVQQIHAQLLGLVDSMADTEMRKASRTSISAVEYFVPNAKKIAMSEGFKAWVYSLPKATQSLYIDIVNNTPKYVPGDVLMMFANFAGATEEDVFAVEWRPGDELSFDVEASAPATGAANTRQDRGRQAPRTLDRGRGGSSGGAMPQRPRPQAHGQGQPEKLLPLSTDEMANFRVLMGNAKSAEERAILSKRLALTNPTFGNIPYMVEGHKG